jgi:hypothetical protein
LLCSAFDDAESACGDRAGGSDRRRPETIADLVDRGCRTLRFVGVGRVVVGVGEQVELLGPTGEVRGRHTQQANAG